MNIILNNVGMIEEANIAINGLTIIAGDNDTGKSTVGKVAYSLTKSFQDFELNYRKSKNEKIIRHAYKIFKEIRKNVDFKKREDLRKIALELLRITDRFSLMSEKKSALLKQIIKKFEKILDEDKLEIKEETKNSLIERINEIKRISGENKPSDEKIIDSIRRILLSEFGHQINNFSAETSKISVLDGKNSIIDISIKDDEIANNSQEDTSRPANQKTSQIFPFDSCVFIETPLILNYKGLIEERSEYGRTQNVPYHVQDLLRSLRHNNARSEGSSLNIDKIIKGNISYDEFGDDFSFEKNHENEKAGINILNSASGIKSFGMLQLLDKANKFNENMLLIIDEPEVHLHPSWQIEYARLLVKIVEKGASVLVTSHNPYLIEALDKFSKERNIKDKIAFYLTELTPENKVKIIDKTKDNEEIFSKFSKPFEELIFEK